MTWITEKWPVFGVKRSESPSSRTKWQDWCGGAMLAMMVLASLAMMIWSLPAPSMVDSWPREPARSVLHTHTSVESVLHTHTSVESVCSLEMASASQDTLPNC